MTDDPLLEILRCPEDMSPLAWADAGLIARLNRAIAAGEVVNQSGHKVRTPVENGLVRAAGDRLYPVVKQIPVMLPSEAISLDQLEKDHG